MLNGTSMASPQAAGAARAARQRRRAGRRPAPARRSSARRSTRRPGSSTDYGAYRAGQRAHPGPGGLGRSSPPTDEDRRYHVGGPGRHGPRAVPCDARRRRRDPRPRGRDPRRGVRPDLHLHPHVGWRRVHDVQPVVGRQRRDVRARRDDPHAAEGRARELDGQHRPDRVRGPLGDPQPRRPEQPRYRIPDAQHGRRRARVQRAPATATRSPGPWLATSTSATSSRSSPARRPSRSTSAVRARRPGPARPDSCGSIRSASVSTATPASCATRRRSRPAAPAPAADRSAGPPTNPQPGVWEVTVEARRTSDIEFVPFTLTASVLGATVSPNPDVIASATIGVPVARSYTMTNLFGAFTGRAVGTTLGSAFRDRPTHRQPGPAAARSSRSRRGPPRCARRSATHPTRRPTSTCSCSTARPGPASSPARAPTATPRSR